MVENVDDIYKTLAVWETIGYGKPIRILNYYGLELYVERSEGEVYLSLHIDDAHVMTTKEFEHKAMRKAAELCPQNARAFVGGLGIGLVLMYLAQMNKTTEVIVSEVDNRLMHTLEPNIRKYLKANYPDFKFQIIESDAYAEILNHGKFDWVFIDLSDGTPDAFADLSKRVLNPDGVFTTWNEVMNG